ncbi:hypothetical protein KWS_0113750 [Xanthomonas vasicola pv. musacearum NCPPB 4384]|nr:hypothetical protein [Xanthomonas vasicola]KFA32510.1 hypothetical protein KWS_0113750 [Xanthomonas vasicola pv. musacearum NCPPB 4384]
MTNIGWSGESVRRSDGSEVTLAVVVAAGVVVDVMARGALSVTVAAGDGIAAALVSGASWPPQELSRQGSKAHGSSIGLRNRRRIIGCSIELGGQGQAHAALPIAWRGVCQFDDAGRMLASRAAKGGPE